MTVTEFMKQYPNRRPKRICGQTNLIGEQLFKVVATVAGEIDLIDVWVAEPQNEKERTYVNKNVRTGWLQ